MIISETLIKECKRYNKLAQRELYEVYLPIFRSLCRRYADCDDDAKDIVQEGFIKIFSKIKQYKGKGSFEGWMKRIMINTALSYYHKKTSKKELEYIDNMDHDKTDYTVQHEQEILQIDKGDISMEEVGFDMVYNANFSYEELYGMLDSLSKPFRDVFNLYCIEGLKHQEIAKILKIDEKTSRTRLSRARERLKSLLVSNCIQKVGR